jgi:hypothetical protein
LRAGMLLDDRPDLDCLLARAIQRIAGLLVNALRVTGFATDADTAGRLLAAAVAGPRPGDSGAYIDRGTMTPSSPPRMTVA